MNPFKCRVCGGELKIKLGAGLFVCDSCGNTSDVDPADAAKYRAVCESAEDSMRKHTAAGYRDALRELEPISFVDRAEEEANACRQRLQTLQEHQVQRQTFEKASGKKDTAFGVLLVALILLFLVGAAVGAVVLIVQLFNGTLSGTTLWIVIGAVVAALLLFLVGKSN